MRIKEMKRSKTFNNRYRSLYTKLDKRREEKAQMYLIIYRTLFKIIKSLEKKLSMKDDISMDKAFKIAQKRWIDFL